MHYARNHRFNQPPSYNIAEGKSADFIILKENLFDVDKFEIHETKVTSTYYRGKQAYSPQNIPTNAMIAQPALWQQSWLQFILADLFNKSRILVISAPY